MENSVVLNLSESHKKELTDFFKSKLEVAQLQVLEFKGILEQLGYNETEDKSLDSSKSDYSPKQESKQLEKPPITSSYKNSWSWTSKIHFVLSKVGRCLTTREIVEELDKYEKNLERPIKGVSSTLSNKIGRGIIFNRYQADEDETTSFGHGIYFNGLKEWFDEQGNLIDEKYKGKE